MIGLLILIFVVIPAIIGMILGFSDMFSSGSSISDDERKHINAVGRVDYILSPEEYEKWYKSLDRKRRDWAEHPDVYRDLYQYREEWWAQSSSL